MSYPGCRKFTAAFGSFGRRSNKQIQVNGEHRHFRRYDVQYRSIGEPEPPERTSASRVDAGDSYLLTPLDDVSEHVKQSVLPPSTVATPPLSRWLFGRICGRNGGETGGHRPSSRPRCAPASRVPSHARRLPRP